MSKKDNSKNLPVKKKKKKPSILSEAQGQIFASVMENVLPKVLPLVNPAIEKFDEYLGDNDKTIIIRKSSKNSPAVVIILDNNTGSYSITCDEGKQNFEASEDAIKDVYNIKNFIDKLLTEGISNK